jgi:hypothetical protein
MELITAADVRRLLDSGGDNPQLVVAEGRVRVVEDAAAGRNTGALVVADRNQLRATVSDVNLDDPSEADLRAVAERLNTAITHLGG